MSHKHLIISACTIIPPMKRSKSNYLKILSNDFLVIRVCYVSRSNTLKSWISERIIIAFLRSRAFHTHFSRAEITGICMNMVGYWIFRMKISTLSQIWGQHTEAPWNSTCAHMFSFFLASRFEVWKWILRLQVQRVSFAKLWHVRVLGTPGMRDTPEQRAIVSIDT